MSRVVEDVAIIGAHATPVTRERPRPLRQMFADVAIGDSICVQGVCLTVTATRARGFTADVSAQTLEVTTGLDRPGEVNLEKSLALGERLGGHLVTGHVDGLGEAVEVAPEGGSVRVVIRAPAEIGSYVAEKGSIAVDGVSLTVNELNDVAGGATDFSVNIIPHTAGHTTLGQLAAGDRLNLEIDVLARYLQRLESTRR